MFLSPTLEKGSRFPCPVLGKGSIGSPVQYWEKVLGSPNQYWEKFQVPQSITGKIFKFSSPCSTGKRFYKFPSPILGKGSIGSPVHYWVKIVYFLKSQHWKKVLGSSVHY